MRVIVGEVLRHGSANAIGGTGYQKRSWRAHGIFNPPLTDSTSPVTYVPRSAMYSTASAMSRGSAKRLINSRDWIFLLMCTQQGGGHVGIDDARCHRVDADIARRQLHRQGTGQGFDPALGSGIVALAFAGLLCRHRTDVDDATATLAQHARHHLLTAEHRADQVGLDHLDQVAR